MRFSETHDTYGDHGSALGHDLRFVASAISHIFSAFGEVLQLNKRYADISGFTARVFGKVLKKNMGVLLLFLMLNLRLKLFRTGADADCHCK